MQDDCYSCTLYSPRRERMNKNICNEVSLLNDKKFESDDPTDRILRADETLLCQMIFVANAQELLCRLYVEGYHIEQVHTKSPRVNRAKIVDAMKGSDF
jgi:regulator of replication initiation timing